jgi:hypothetical protein
MSDDQTAVLETRPLVAPDSLPDLLGWTLEPQGLCRGDMCVPIPDRSLVEREGTVDLAIVAELLDRPLVSDDAAGLVAIGAARSRRREALGELRAPDFRLPDLDGTFHALSDHRSKKRLLVAFASW